MEIFADTANLDDIARLKNLGIISGCTTNPLICARAGISDMRTHADKILNVLGSDDHLSLEVTTNDYDEMVGQISDMLSWSNSDHRIAIKVPMSENGILAARHQFKRKVRFNVTACMNSNQAFLAAKAGAAYVSLFWGRIEDMGYDAAQIVQNVHQMFELGHMKTQIIIGSLRTVSDFTRASKTSADILTVPPELLYKLLYHPRTESTINEFLSEYAKLSKR